MSIEIRTIDRRWYRFITKPQTKTKNIVASSFLELGLDLYKPTLSVVLGNDALLLELNSQYRKIKKPTNVLSFCYEELSHGCCLGEIFISIDRIAQESLEIGIKIEDHFAHMLIHGILHIIGYDHEVPEEEEKMRSMEVHLLGKLGIHSPYSLEN